MVKYTLMGTDRKTLDTVSIHAGESLTSIYRLFTMLMDEWDSGRWSKIEILKYRDGEPVEHYDLIDRRRHFE